jgi:GDP-L-fucose synthase
MKIIITGGNGNLAKIIKDRLFLYDIKAPGRSEVDLLNIDHIDNYLRGEDFDILIHAAILGGRRTKEETEDIFYKNVLMFENIMQFSHKFKMIINLDSAAIYDRSTDIMARKESDLFTVPKDPYGFSKYVIYKLGSSHSKFYNIRIFNIFHRNEENDRFIKSCNIARRTNERLTIFNDKYFDFFHEDHFVKVIKYYIDNVNKTEILSKNVNMCYEKKYRLSEIAGLIIEDKTKIIILDPELKYNYCGDNAEIKKMKIFEELNMSKDLLIY